MANNQQLPATSSSGETPSGAFCNVPGWWYGSAQNAPDNAAQGGQLQQPVQMHQHAQLPIHAQLQQQLQNQQLQQHYQQLLQPQLVYQQQQQQQQQHQQLLLHQQQLHQQQSLLSSMQPQNSGNAANSATVGGASPSDRTAKVAKPRGRTTAYSYFVHTCREEHKKMFPERQIHFVEFSRQCGERWKTMADAEKERFHAMAKKDKERYELEMKNFVPTKGMPVGRVVKRKTLKDPNAPKRPLTAFFLYIRDEREKVKTRNPMLSVGAIAKELGRMWSTIHPDVKQQYLTKAQQEKRRYDQEMVAYKQQSAGSTVAVEPPNQLMPQPVQAGVVGGFQHLPSDKPVVSSSTSQRPQLDEDDDSEEDTDESDSD